MALASLAPGADPAWAAQNNLPKILAVTGIVHMLALTSVALRLYVRTGLLRTPGRDDVAITGAALCALGGWVCFILQGYHGLGRHTRTISRGDVEDFERLNFVQGVVSSIMALGLLKISIAFFLLRLDKTGRKWYARSLWGLIVFICIYSVGGWLSFFLRCFPMAGFWDQSIDAKCLSMKAFMKIAQVNTAVNICADVCFATLPIPIVWDLHMSHRTRVNIIAVLSLGYIAVILGIVKAIYQMALTKNPDRHFNQHIQFWGFLQLNIGIIAASAPTFKPLLKRAGPNEDGMPADDGFRRSKETGPTKPSKTGWSFLARRGVVLYGGSYELSTESTSDERILRHGGGDAKQVVGTTTTEVVVDDAKQGVASRNSQIA